MNPSKIIIGLIILILILIIFGGGVYIIDYLKADGGVGVTLISGLSSAISHSVYLFAGFMISLVIAGWLLWTGTKREEGTKK